MLIATWNLNNRVGRTTFRPEAAQAAVSIGADLLVLTEYYPGKNGQAFTAGLEQGGYRHHTISPEGAVPANRVLIASKHEILPLELARPDFDEHVKTNVHGCVVPSIGLTVLGIRIPWYKSPQTHFVGQAWDWLEATAGQLLSGPAIILGDLNVSLDSGRTRGRDHLGRMLKSGWHRAAP